MSLLEGEGGGPDEWDQVSLLADAEGLRVRFLRWARNPKRDPSEARVLIEACLDAFDALQVHHTYRKLLHGPLLVDEALAERLADMSDEEGTRAIEADPYVRWSTQVASAIGRAQRIAQRYKPLFLHAAEEVLESDERADSTRTLDLMRFAWLEIMTMRKWRRS